MCGIVGIWTQAHGHDARVHIEAMTMSLRHRGPDAGAVWSDDDSAIFLGHRRLAILDLSERGAQPMQSACGRYVIVFNGEIYNHMQLRKELETTNGHNWRGTSDTETLLACFAAWGVAGTLKKAIGMFAVALWDRTKKQLTLARDRFGEKPLYYGWVGHGNRTAFIFGSELKALRAFPGLGTSIDPGALALFLRFSYVPTPYSIYKDVFKLEPGSILVLNAVDIGCRSCKIEPYWRYEDVALAGLCDPIRDEREGLDLLETVLREAITLQRVADVPLGAFLSGGIDSSTVVALMQAQSGRPVKTFTVGFDEKDFDESPHAAAVAHHLGTDHHEVRVSMKQTRAVIPNLASIYDEPFADASQIPTSIICAVARQSVTVALSGDAGDELFAGYDRYTWGSDIWRTFGWTPAWTRHRLAAMLSAVPVERWNSIGRLPPLSRRFSLLGQKMHKLATALTCAQSVDDLYLSLATEWGAGTVPVRGAPSLTTHLDKIRIETRRWRPEQRMMLFDALTYLPDDILAKVDRAAMSVSLETRVPMLDHRVAEVAWRMPLSMKIRNGRSKWALRQILHRYVPASLVERPKAGFTVPIGHWLRGPLRDWAEALVAKERIRDEGYLDAAHVHALWHEHLNEKRDWSGRLWNVIMFQAWLENQNAPSRPSAAQTLSEVASLG